MKTGTSRGLLKSFVLFILAIIASFPGHSSNLKTTSVFGYDSNPLKLRSSLAPAGSEYLYTHIKGSSNLIGNINVFGEFNGRKYTNSVNEADYFTALLGIDYRFKMNGLRPGARIDLSFKTGMLDKSYVNRNTGDIGIAKSREIKNRQDYRFSAGNILFTYPFSQNLSTSLLFQLEQRQYEDYSHIGLNSLDYRIISAVSKSRYSISHTSSLSVSLVKSRQRYEDRLETNRNGKPIPETYLHYDFHKLILGYNCTLSKNSKISINGLYDVRSDSGGGYFNRDRTQVSALSFYRFSKVSQLRTKASFLQDSYSKLQRSNGNGEEELVFEKSHQLSLNYNHKIMPVEGLRLNVRYEFTTTQSVIQSNQYARHQMSVGLEYRF